MKKPIPFSAVATFLFLLSACAAVQPDPAERIIGRWQTDVGGFPVTVEYSASTVSVGGNPAVSYSLEGDRLRFEGGGAQVRVVAFPSPGEMIQTDPVTGTSHRFVKVE